MRELVLSTMILLTGLLGCGPHDRAPRNPIARAKQDYALLEQSVRQAFQPAVAKANAELDQIASEPRYQVFTFDRMIVFVDRLDSGKRPEQGKRLDVKDSTRGDTFVLRLKLPPGASVKKWTDTVIVAHELDLQYSIASVEIRRNEDSLRTPYVADMELKLQGNRRSLVEKRALRRPPTPTGKILWVPPLEHRMISSFFSASGKQEPEVRVRLFIPKLGVQADRLDQPVENVAQQLEKQEFQAVDDKVHVQLVYSVPQGRWLQPDQPPSPGLVEFLPKPDWSSSLSPGSIALNPVLFDLPEDSKADKEE